MSCYYCSRYNMLIYDDFRAKKISLLHRLELAYGLSIGMTESAYVAELMKLSQEKIAGLK